MSGKLAASNAFHRKLRKFCLQYLPIFAKQALGALATWQAMVKNYFCKLSRERCLTSKLP